MTTQKKGFLEKPENYTTILSFGVLGVLGFMFLDRVLPVVNRVLDYALETTFKTIGLAALLAIVTWVVTSNDLHKLAWLGYQTVMRKLTEFVVLLDPIAIMESYVATLRKNLEGIEKGLASLKGQARELENIIRETASQLKQSQSLAVEAHKRAQGGASNMKAAFLLQSRKAGRLEQSNVTYQGLLNRIKGHIAVMEKVQAAANLMAEDIKDTVQHEKKKRQMITASFKAMNAAKRILAASEQRALYDMALEANTKDYYNKLGEIEQFMTDSQAFIDTMDLQNGVYEADALAKLEEWDKRSQTLLEGGTGTTKYRVDPNQEHDYAAEDEEIDQKLKAGRYSDLFD